ncbi:hypothetical protein AgCh_015075 [Apium graveolens]
MSTFSQISAHLMFSLKVLTISSSICFIAMLLKLSLPHLTTFPLFDFPAVLNAVASWLKPPYLYLVINCIIITIVATSKLQSKFDYYAFSPPPPPQVASVGKSDDEVAADVGFEHFSFSPPHPPGRVYGGGGGVGMSVDLVNTVGIDQVNMGVTETLMATSPLFDYGVANRAGPRDLDVVAVNELKNVKMDGRVFESVKKVEAKNDKDRDLEDPYVKVMNLTSNKVIGGAQEAARVTEFSKPPASSRFGHRKVVKTTPDHQGGKTLKVTKPKKQETLESTWKTITDGRPMPLTRHLRKSDTWENHPAHSTNASDFQDYSKMTKSETFNDRTTRKTNSSMLSRSSGSRKLKKDPSLGQDELNKRVEAFITKFNEEMRLQRQESLNQYMEMINRGAGP